MNRRINRHVRYGLAADVITLPVRVSEVQEPADVVILVETRKQVLRFFGQQPERGERHGIAERASQRGVALHNVAKRNLWRALRRFGGHNLHAECSAAQPDAEDGIWRAARRFGKMLCGNSFSRRNAS